MRRKIKWLVGGTAACAVIAYAAIRLFYTVQENEWGIQRQAVQTAYAKSTLVKPLKVEPFIGSKPYTVIQGEDKIGQPIIVWVSEDEVHSEMAADGITMEQVEQLLLEQEPQADLLRITPAKWSERLAWEAFYKVKSDQGYRYFYKYYAFEDGTLLDTYRLSLQ